MSWLGDLMGDDPLNNNSPFDLSGLTDQSPPPSFYSDYNQATGVGGPGTTPIYNSEGVLVDTPNTGGDTSGGITNTGGTGAGSAITDLLKKYGLPALLAGLAAADRQKATGGGYGKAYQSPSPLTRTMSQGKYGPIAKYAAEGGIIQGYAGGGQLSADQLSPDVASMVNRIENTARYGTPEENQKAVNLFRSFMPGSAFAGGISGLAQKVNEGDYSGAAKSMIPGMNTFDALQAGDVSGVASGLANLIPGVSVGKAIYNLFNSSPSQSSQAADYASAFGNPETGRNVSPQVLNEITSTLANYDPQDINAAVMATIPEINTTQANSTQGSDLGAMNSYGGGQDRYNYDYVMGGMGGVGDISNPPPFSYSGTAPPSGMPKLDSSDFNTTRGFTVPETSNSTQGADLGAFNQGDSGAAPESSYGYTGPDYGGYDGGAGIGGGGNFNDSSGPGEGGGGGGMWNGEYVNRSSYAQGGIAAMAKGRFLRGPGDGVSDSIPATIDGRQPAALADGEFVIPARVVSELGNGSSEAGARKLHEMMIRIQRDRRGTKDIAANTKVDRHLPA